MTVCAKRRQLYRKMFSFAGLTSQSQWYITSGKGNFGNISLADKVSPEMLHLVDAVWYQYAPISSLWYKIIGIYIFCVGLLSGIGNGLVVYVFATTPSLRTPSNLFIVNLAFSDFCMVFYMTPVMVYNSVYEEWCFSSFACSLYGVVGSIFGVSSIWTMVLIALDRYNVIVKGIGSKKLTMTSAITIIIFIWLHGMVWTVLPLFGWNRYVPEGNMTSCGIDYLTKSWFSRSYILIYSIFAYFTPLFTIAWSYYHIVHTVFEHEKNMRNQAKKMNITSLRADDDGGTRTEIKIAKVSLMVIALWFMSWTPYLIINYSSIFELFPVTPLGTIIGAIATKSNSICNPIVYAISHPKYKAALDEKFPFLKSKTNKSDTTSIKTNGTDA